MFWVGVSAVVAAAASTLLLLLHLPVELLECVVVLALERGSAWFCHLGLVRGWDQSMPGWCALTLLFLLVLLVICELQQQLSKCGKSCSISRSIWPLPRTRSTRFLSSEFQEAE